MSSEDHHDQTDEQPTGSVDSTASSSPDEEARLEAERARWVSDLIARGEAAWPVDGQLPPGATHEIV